MSLPTRCWCDWPEHVLIGDWIGEYRVFGLAHHLEDGETRLTWATGRLLGDWRNHPPKRFTKPTDIFA